MINLSLLSMFLSACCLFAAARKVEYEKKGVMLYLSEQPGLARALSILLFVGGISVLTIELGTANGILSGLVLWTMFASLLLLFAPFGKIRGQHVFIVAILLILIELFL